MGRRGPAPTPTATLRMRGSWRAAERKGEPQPQAGRPQMPSWLDPLAKRAWRSLVEQLEAMRVLTKADGNALARYCKLWSRWRAAEKFLDKHGTTYDGDGGLRSYPQVRESSMLVGHLARLEQQFGLTPAARARLIAIDTGSAGKGEPKSKKRFFSTG